MPTQPDLRLLDREAALADNADAIRATDALLLEVINRATSMLGKWYDRTGWYEGFGPADGEQPAKERSREEVRTEFAVMSIMETMVSTLDGIRVLLANSCDDVARPLLRSVFDCDLALRYIHAIPSLGHKRARAWFTGWAFDRQMANSWLDPESPKGKSFRRGTDYEMNEMFANKSKLDAFRNVRRLMSEGESAEMYQEYEALPRPRFWHALDGGPLNTKELARMVERGSLYEMMYADWSQRLHGVQVREGAFREGNSILPVGYWAAELGEDALRILFENHFPKGPEHYEWLASDFGPLLGELVKLTVRAASDANDDLPSK